MKRSIILLVLAACVAGAQTTSTEILGTITDPNGAVIANAVIDAARAGTGEHRAVKSDADGRYLIPNLDVGQYDLTVEAPGFQRQRLGGVVLELNQKARLDVQLKLGNVQQTVEVNAAAPVLKTDDATLGEVVDNRRIVELPLNGRNFAQLATIATPGVRMGYQTYGGGERLYAGGQRENENQFQLDGSVIQNNLLNSVSFRPSVDAIEEFKVQTGAFAAEYGMFSGAQVTISLRSGTNSLHGTAFEFLRNDVLDARTFFENPANPKAPLRRNQFGFVLSGPVYIPKLYNGKNKTFFMVNSEFLRLRQSGASLLNVPTAAQRAGDLSTIAKIAKDPLTGQAFPGNLIPQSRIAPAATALLGYAPLPNTAGSANYLATTLNNANNTEFVTRIDQNFGDKDHLFGHFIRQINTTSVVPDLPESLQHETTRDWNAAIGYTRLLSPNAINELRLGYTRLILADTNSFTNTNFNIQQALGMTGFPSDSFATGLPGIAVTGYLNYANVGPTYQVDETAQISENFSYIHGAHALKFGVDIRKGRIARQVANYPRGSLSFTGDMTGNALADFLLGLPRSVTGVEPLNWAEARGWRMGFYGQDDWRVTDKLTLNLGIRYDLNTVPVDPYGRLRTLNPSDPTQLIPAPYVEQAPFKGDHNNFAPRIGFAYRPFGNKTVFRGGYGIYYDANQLNNFTLLQNNPPFHLVPTLVSDPASPSLNIANPFSVNGALPTGPFNLVTIDLCGCLPNPLSQNYTFNVQRQLPSDAALEIGYVGAHTVHLDQANQLNAAPPGPGAVQPRRPYPMWADIRAIQNDVSSSYNALQVSLRKRMTHGLTVLATYAFSKTIDDGNDFNSGDRIMDPTRRYLDRGVSQFDYPHRITASAVYQLPFFANASSSFVRTALAGWQVDAIWTFESGRPFSVYASGDIANSGSVNQRANRIADGHLANPTLQEWFDVTAFTNPAPYTYGTAGRDILRGPRTDTIDGGLFKNFHFTEKQNLEFRAEFFSFTNTPIFNLPNSTVNTPTFGQVTSVSGGNRTIQFGLKYQF
jgi:hypothetical protein